MAWTLLQQHPPARRNSLLAAKGELASGVRGSPWPGMLWVAGAWQAWISKAAVGQGLAVAEQPGDAGGTWGDVGWVGGPQPPAPWPAVSCAVLCISTCFIVVQGLQ